MAEDLNDDFGRKNLIRLHDIRTGEIIKSAQYVIDSLIIDLCWIYPIEETERFIIVGGAHYENDSIERGYFLVTNWDRDLNLISDSIYRLEPFIRNQYLWHHNGRITSDGKCIYIGVYSNLQGFGDNLLVQLTRFGQIEKYKPINYFHGAIFSSSIEEKIDQEGYFQGFGLRNYVFNENLDRVDTLYNLDHPLFMTQAYIKKLDDESYLVTNSFEGGFNPAIVKIDSDLNILAQYDFGLSSNEFESTLIGKAIVWDDTSSIYVGANEVLQSRYFSIAKFNSNLGLQWIKYYGLDDDHGYIMYSLLSTEDNGCIVVGRRGDRYESTLNFQSRAWAIKFDSEGNTVSTQESNAQAWSATVFPNPSPGYLKLRMEGNTSESTLQLLNMAGKKVAGFSYLDFGENRFDLNYLPSGIYVWQLHHRGELIGSGKWVKD